MKQLILPLIFWIAYINAGKDLPTTPYSSQGEFAIRRNQLLTTLKSVGKQYSVSFQIKVNGITNKNMGFASILELGFGGARSVRVQLLRNAGFRICIYQYVPCGWTKENPIGKWMSMKMVQFKTDSGYQFQAFIDKKLVFNTNVCKTYANKNVKLYAGGKISGQSVVIRNLVIGGVSPKNIMIPNALCDLRKQDCSPLNLIADNIITGDVNCSFANQFVHTADVAVVGKLVGYTEVICELPTNAIVDKYLTVKNGIADMTWRVSIINDGGKVGTSDQFFKVYDSKCLHCTDAAKKCSLKKDTCMISGYCFLDGEVDPRDTKKCKACVPSVSTEKFSLRLDLPPECQDRCKTTSGCCSQVCTNKNGRAVCYDGYALAGDGKTCIKGQCKIANGGCSQTCTNTNGKAVCSCNYGYTLAEDKKTCIKVTPRTCMEKKCKDKLNFAAVGCFHQDVASMKSMKMLFNIRHTIKWDEEGFKAFACGAVCRCGQEAKHKGYKFFSIRFHGVCMAGFNQVGITESMGNESKKSKACVRGDGTYRPCDNSGECVGGQDSDYIYRL